MALYFKQRGSKVVAIEDSLAITSDSALWYQWEQLVSAGLTPWQTDLSSINIENILNKEKPDIIVYVPSLLYDRIGNIKSEKYASTFKNFLNLLTATHERLKDSEVIFPSLSSVLSTSIQSSWLSAFEQTLSSYNNVYQLKTTIVKIEGAYGPGKESTETRNCWYIDDIFSAVNNFVSTDSNCITYIVADCSDRANIPHLTNGTKGTSLYKDWLLKYSQRKESQNKRVIMTTYFTGRRNPQYRKTFLNDNFRFMEDWFMSLYRLNLNMVIFHNNLSPQFTNPIQQNYPHVQFLQMSDFNGRTPNDRRMFLFYEYLLSHPDISHAIITDLRDVRIASNPFEVMDVLGDHPYIGLDNPFKTGFNKNKLWLSCLPNDEYDKDYYETWPYFNAGALGGRRETLLLVLERITSNLHFNPKDNCNMPALYISVHRYFLDTMFFGWPFQFGFVTHHPGMIGNCIFHK